MKRYKIKFTHNVYVLHSQKQIAGRKVFRRVWGIFFFTESVARTFAEGNF